MGDHSAQASPHFSAASVRRGAEGTDGLMLKPVEYGEEVAKTLQKDHPSRCLGDMVLTDWCNPSTEAR